MAVANDELPLLIQRLTPRIASYFPEMGPCRVRASGRPRELDSCRLYKIEVVAADGAAAPLAAKVFRVGPRRTYNLGEALRTQFESLQEAVALARRVPGVVGPRPLDVFEDLGVLVMEWVEGRRLLDCLASDLAGPRSRALVRTCGEWLHHFHEHRQTDPSDPRIVEKLNQVRLCVEDLGKEGLPRDLLRRVESHMAAQAAVLDGVSVPSCHSHLDFSASNVMVDRLGRLAVLDIGREVAPRDSDVAGFLVSLEKAPLHPCRFGLTRGRILALQRAFLEGYSGAGVAPSTLTSFQFIRLLLLTACYYLESYRGRRIQHLWLRLFFARRLARALDVSQSAAPPVP
jgi:hypothetical protein